MDCCLFGVLILNLIYFHVLLSKSSITIITSITLVNIRLRFEKIAVQSLTSFKLAKKGL